MKAEIDGKGKLTLIPENPTEEFAAKVWFEKYADPASVLRGSLTVGEFMEPAPRDRT